jgi:hypothetical protein
LRIASAGLSLDRRLVESAALLHDIDKLNSVRPSVASLDHGAGSAAWLAENGYPELGPAIVGHPVTRLADGAWFEHWLDTASPEALVVAYADKRAGQKLESMSDRFASWERRYPPQQRPRDSWSDETLTAVRHRAEVLEGRVCEMAGVGAGDVRRLPWTARSLQAVREGRAT